LQFLFKKPFKVKDADVFGKKTFYYVADVSPNYSGTEQGNLKIINSSKNILDVQGVTIQYFDNSGNPVAFKKERRRWRSRLTGQTFSQGSMQRII
jgi:outer membrane protein assembly factor BamE (lipoprotein component of BamABCDE complex)